MKKQDKVSIGFASISLPSLALGLKLARRGSRLRNLQRLVPKVTTESIPTFQKNLKPGDVLLVGKETKGIFPKLKTKVFQLSEGKYIHSAIYLGDGRLAHIGPGRDVHTRTLSDYLKKGDKGLIAIRPNVSDTTRRRMVSHAEQALKMNNYKYDSGLARMAIFGDTNLERIALDKVFGRDPIDGKVLCSSFVADIQKKVGVVHTKSPRMMTSIDFRSLSNPPVVQFKPKGEATFKTSRFQGAGFTIPAIAQGTYEYKRRK